MVAEKSSANEAAASAPTRVAILGAGIGGTSAAYFLRQKLPNAEIDILEMDKGTVPYLIKKRENIFFLADQSNVSDPGPFGPDPDQTYS